MTTKVEARSANGADAGVTVTRSYVAATGSHTGSSTYRFDEMIALVSRCLRFTGGYQIGYRVHILEDSRSADGPRRFRYSLTTTLPSGTIKTAYMSYARLSGLIVSGSSRIGHQQAFDALFEDTLRRIRAP